MNTRIETMAWIFLVSILMISCSKDFSYEGGVGPLMARGSLQDSLHNCRDIQVAGNYIKDSILNQANYLVVKVNITLPGRYVVYSDTVNGYWFRDSGMIANTGLQQLTLKGYGKPFSPIAATYTIHFDTSTCSFTMPANAAVYRFNGNANSCPSITVNGIYRVGAKLNAGDSINVPIKVLIPGTYAIETALVNGMQFCAKGVFLNSGDYVVSLLGQGRPNDKGTSQIPLTINNAVCSFPVDAILDTTMYWKCTVEGVEYRGLLDSSYGSLPDTGIFIIGNPTRIFEAGAGGGDMNNSINNYTFGIELSRINTPITTGNYFPCEVLGSCDFAASLQLNINITPTNIGDFYSIYQHLGNFRVYLTSFDRNSKVIQGNFDGSVYKTTNLKPNSNSPVFQMTKGEFKTYMAY